MAKDKTLFDGTREFDHAGHEGTVLAAMGFNWLLRHWGPAIFITSISALFSLLVVARELHLDMNDTDVVGSLTAELLYSIPASWHFWGIFVCLMVAWMVVLGMQMRFTRTKYAGMFLDARIKSGRGKTPVLLGMKKIASGMMQYKFDGHGVTVESLEANKEALEAQFRGDIVEFKKGDDNRHFEIITSKVKLPKSLNFYDLKPDKILTPYSFIVGKARNGVMVQKAEEMPHMLIAGATGGGKSVFFKQALLGLLKSSPHIQMYLLDLKSGLEMADFKDAPNVKIYKNIRTATEVLEALCKEMDARYKKLEASGELKLEKNNINRDRLVVAVDEAAVIYGKPQKDDPEYAFRIRARAATEKLATLSRAAGFHLILATQKLVADNISTIISDNVTTRMCFRMPSVTASNQVIMSSMAQKISYCPGRGIWGSELNPVEVQAPYISSEAIRAECQNIAAEFKSGKRKLLGAMIDPTSQGKKDQDLVNKQSK